MLKDYSFPKILILVLLPAVSLTCIPIYIYINGIVWQEPVILIMGWVLSGLGITIGYHRLFSHKAFKTHVFVEWIFMFLASMAIQNTIVKWCSDHRRHHKKLDTDDDPYSITEGFFHAHMGWLLYKEDTKVSGVSDLQKKSAVKFQSKYYAHIVLVSLFLPLIIGLFYHRPIGAMLWGGILRITLVHHFTWFVNSLAHFIGRRNYDLHTSARDSWITSIFTFGEGYHNYHHTFQWDYRNGVRWYNFDPSKWVIRVLSYFNITYDLRRASDYNIFKARFKTLNDKINSFSHNQDNLIKIKELNKKSLSELELWRILEKKYESLKKTSVDKYEKLDLIKKMKNHQLELEKYMSLLTVILMNLRNYH